MKRVVITLAVLTVIAAYLVCKPNQSADKYKDGSVIQGIVSTAFINNSTSDTHTGGTENKSPCWYQSPEWVLAIIAALTFIAIWYQARETKRAAEATQEATEGIRQQARILERQTKATETAADAARKNVQALIDSERAWLLGPSAKLTEIIPTSSSNIFFFSVPIENLGKSVGRIVKTSASCGLYGALPAEPDYKVQGECDVVLAPHGVHKLWVGIQASDLEYVRAKRGNRLYFYGFVQYFDVGRDALRETRFCYVYHIPTDYTPDPEGFYPDPNAWPTYTKCN